MIWECLFHLSISYTDFDHWSSLCSAIVLFLSWLASRFSSVYWSARVEDLGQEGLHSWSKLSCTIMMLLPSLKSTYRGIGNSFLSSWIPMPPKSTQTCGRSLHLKYFTLGKVARVKSYMHKTSQLKRMGACVNYHLAHSLFWNFLPPLWGVVPVIISRLPLLLHYAPIKIDCFYFGYCFNFESVMACFDLGLHPPLWCSPWKMCECVGQACCLGIGDSQIMQGMLFILEEPSLRGLLLFSVSVETGPSVHQLLQISVPRTWQLLEEDGFSVQELHHGFC